MWIKKGLLYNSHAQLPTVEDRNDVLRIYYSYRIDNKSHISFFELNQNLKLIYDHKKSVFGPGERGCFDDAGVMPSCIHQNILYYTGWNRKTDIPYGHAIGAAIFNEQQECFERFHDGPVLDRCPEIPYLANSPWVNEKEMWFCNGTGWDGDFPTYQICKANYTDHWQVGPSEIGDQHEACSRPCVTKFGIYFAKRTKNTNYSIYHIINDSISQIITPSDSGWDSEMTCYPYLHNNIMFYNGNGYGTTGIGYAIEI